MLRSSLLFLLTQVLVFANPAATAPIRFEHLTINDGLPENSVRSILQDRHGFLWFGTQNGVARYDGNDMKIHLPDPDNPHSIGVRFVLAMAEDDTGSIWMGSYSAGVSRYNSRLETFTNFETTGDSLPGPGIADVKAADDGVWISSTNGGLYRARGDEFELIAVPPFNSSPVTGLTGLNVTNRELWVGSSRNGIAIQDRTTEEWHHWQA